ncbi:UNVERIFIED_ORG: DUF881 domain-containing protein [Bacillus sp. AZ43]
MTGVPRGGGARSLGASLLDDVLAETVDPAYAQAAAARASGAPRRTGRGRVLVALTMVVAGLLLAVTYEQAAATVQGRQQIRAALVDDVQRESSVTDELAAQLESLRAEVASTRDELLDASAAGQRAGEALDEAEEGAGAVPVTGPGLLVTLANADPSADEDPVGGETDDDDPRTKVRDGYLQVVVNALWAAGAEAVSVNGQRLGPATAIRFAGDAVLVDFRPVTNPYQVRAIGDPDTLSTRFIADPDVVALAGISEVFGLRFDFSREDELSLPAGTIPELRHARPEGEEPAESTPDPTPGG